MRATWDLTQLDQLTRDLDTAKAGVITEGTRAVKRGAQDVKTGAAAIASAIGPHVKQYPAAISYDLTVDGTTVFAEIGPDKDRPQGALGNILEYGTSKNAPIPHLAPPLDQAVPGLEDALAEIAGKQLEGR